MFRIFVLAILSSLSATLAFAQTTSATTATVTGTVTDQQSGVLPGVTVSLSGSSMMGVQTQVTDSVGLYRFVSIPPGEYKLVFELARLRHGQPRGRTSDRRLHRDDQHADGGRHPDRERAGDRRLARRRHAVDDDQHDVRQGHARESAERARLLGRAVRGARRQAGAHRRRRQRRGDADQLLRVRHDRAEPADGRRHQLDREHGIVRQLRRLRIVLRRSRSAAAPSSAESPVPGVYTVLVSKSGGNRYSGSFYGDYESKDWQSFNIDSAQVAAGVSGGGGLEPRDVNRLNSYRDLNADIGGFLKKDSVWWYASVRSLDSAARYTNFPVKPHETHLGNFTIKDDLSVVAEQQDHRLLPAEHESAEQRGSTGSCSAAPRRSI